MELEEPRIYCIICALRARLLESLARKQMVSLRGWASWFNPAGIPGDLQVEARHLCPDCAADVEVMFERLRSERVEG